ncbi:MAG: hypothetical protein U1F41_05805 [Burkholderiales bacterium]
MSDRAAILVLELAAEVGALSAFVALHEIAEHTSGRAFVAAELARDAVTPGRDRLRRALEAACGVEFGPRKLGRFLAAWADAPVVSLRVKAIGEDPAGLVWEVSRAANHIRAAAVADACEHRSGRNT